MERAYRGALDKQYFDALYIAAELHRRLGGLDLLLRGPAVSYAAPAQPTPALRIGNRTVDTLTDPRRDLATLIEAGARVWAERADLAVFAPGSEGRLHDGVRLAEPGELAARWPDYRMVCFL